MRKSSLRHLRLSLAKRSQSSWQGANHKPHRELTGTVVYRAGCGTQLTVVLVSYCEGYSYSRTVSLNAQLFAAPAACHVLGHPITCLMLRYLMYLSGKHWPLWTQVGIPRSKLSNVS